MQILKKHVKPYITHLTNLQENFEITTNMNKLKVPIKPKDMNTATGATSVKNNSKRIGQFPIRRNLSVR